MQRSQVQDRKSFLQFMATQKEAKNFVKWEFNINNNRKMDKINKKDKIDP